jgi:hypothetical protein
VSGNLGVGATVRGGIGIVGVASVGLYTDVGGSWNFRAPEQGNSIYHSFSVELSFGAYAELIFVFDWEWEWFHASWPSMQMENTAIESSSSSWGVMPRNYGNPSWVNNNDGLLINNAFPMAHPSIGRNSEGDKMMVWAEDDKSKAAGGNGLDLWYSIWNTNTKKWNQRIRLTDDNLAQSNPSIAVLDNGHAICVFNCLTEPIGERSVIQAAKDSEIGYCYWDGTSWSSPQLIADGGTSGHFMDSYPVIKSYGNNAVVVWMCDDDPAGITVNDRLLYSSFWDGTNWSSPEIIVNDNIISLPVSLSYNGNEAACAYAVDENGVIQNPDNENQNIYITSFTPSGSFGTKNDNTIQITNGGVNAHPAVNYINSDYPSISWMEEDTQDKNVKILYQDGVGSFSSFGPEVVFDGLDQGSSTSLFKAGYGSLKTADKPVVAWSDGKNLGYKRKFGSTWEDLQLLHMSDEEIVQTTWDYDGQGDEIFAVFLEKDEVTDTQGVQMFEAGQMDLLPPQIPYKPLGPGVGNIDKVYEFETSSYDPTPLKRLKYGWDWDDGSPIEWTGWIDSGEICKRTHSWDEEGEYNIKVKAKNEFKESGWSQISRIDISEVNLPPTTPDITAPSSIKPNTPFDYEFLSTDPESEQIRYIVNFDSTGGGGDTTYGPKPSGETLVVRKSYSNTGTFTITAKAKDESGQFSGEATHTIQVSRSKTKNKPKITLFFENLQNLFPNLWKYLQLFQQFLIKN